MSFKFLRFRRIQVTGEFAPPHAEAGPALPADPGPVENGRIKALARDRFARADRMMQSLAANDEEGEGARSDSRRSASA